MECREDLERLTGYIFETEYKDMLESLTSEEVYLENGIITEEEVEELENLDGDDPREEEIVNKCSMNPLNLHIYAITHRVWKELLQE